jgi:processive 1,2-diacylglycerol beta-glucosyltransferase
MTKTIREKILILSGALGDGHMQAARAIVEASELYRPGAAVKVVDFMEWIHPRMHVIERYCFLHWVKHFPSMYGYLYRKTRADNSLSYFLKQFRSSSLNRLLMLIQDEQPTVIVSTFPPASAAISMLKAKGMTNLPAVTVITDHSDHSYWIQPCTDLYLVGSEGVRIALRDKGVPDGNIAVTGIPVRPSYTQSWDRNRLRDKYGIASSSFVVLVMGGGFGMIDKSFIDQLKSEFLPPNIQFIMICGRNVKLQHRLHEALCDRENVRLEGYVEEIHEWMGVADVLITKPGGLTTSEALARQLPMLLFDPQLGQERDNADYLIRAGVAIPCRIGDLQSQLGQLAQNPELLQRMKEKAGECGQQNSAAHALMHILNATRSAMESAWGSSVQQYA